VLRPPILIFFLIGIINAINAQDPAVVFGNITLKDFEIKNTLDSNASAIVLYEKGITNDAFSYHARIKILKADGLGWANVRMQYRSRYGEASVEGATYNLENGEIEVSKLETQSVFKLRELENPDQLNFAMPNVRVGSIIEYRYKITDSFYVNWEFQKTIPVLWSEYTRSLLLQNTVLRGNIPFTISEDVKEGRRWVIANIPSFKEEPNMLDPNDHLSSLDFFYPNGNWEEINRKLLSHPKFGPIVNGDYIDGNLVKKIIHGIDVPLLKIKFIMNFIKQNVRWNGQEDLLADHPDDILKRKYGSSGDVNLLLIGMLQKAGIKAEPILISTRENGVVHKEITNIDQFNYVICQAIIDNTKVLLDATEKFLPYDVLPVSCLNHYGMIVNNNREKNGQWIEINYKAKEKTVLDASMSLKDDGSFEGQLVSINEGYAALSSRKKITKGEDEYFKEAVKDKTWQLNKTEIDGLNDIYGPLKITYNLSIFDHSSNSNNLLYFNPFFNLSEEKNPFVEKERKHPIDFGVPIDKVYVSTIVIPDAYVIEQLPEKKAFILPGGFGKYLYNITVVGNKITISCIFSITKTIFLPNEYPFLRELYSIYIAKQSEQIILRHK
jgi:hypothetical protein